MRHLLTVILLVLSPVAYGQAATKVGSGIQVVPRASSPPKDPANGAFWSNSTDSNRPYYTNPAGSMVPLLTTLFVDPPLVGNGTAASHLTCPTCVVTSASYADPSWITSLAGSKITGGPLTLNLSYAALVGTGRFGILANLADQTGIYDFTPSDPGTTAWHQWMSSFANTSGARNQVMRFGWNVNPGGGRQVGGALNGALTDEWEQRYLTVSPSWVMERHLAFINPADGITRFISFMGGLEAPYSTQLYLRAGEVNLGYGATANDQPSLVIQNGVTTLRTAVPNPRIVLDETGGGGGGALTLAIGAAGGDTSKATLTMNYLGGIDLNTKFVARLTSNATPGYNVEWAAAYTALKNPTDATDFYQLDDNGHFFFINNGFRFSIRQDAVYLDSIHMRPNVDRSASISLGTSGGRFGFAGLSLAAASLPTCNADSEGFTTNVPGVTGALATTSNLKTCAKQADDSYAWVDANSAISTDGNLGTTITPGVVRENVTAAAAGAQQVGYAYESCGRGWKTNATAASQAVCSGMYTRPVQGAAAPTVDEVWYTNVAGGGRTPRLRFNYDGTNVNLYNASADTGLRMSSNTASLIAAGSSANVGFTFDAWRPSAQRSVSNGTQQGSWGQSWSAVYLSTTNGAAPITCAVNTGAGTGGTCALGANSTSTAGTFTVTTGTGSAGGNAVITTITLTGNSFVNQPPVCQVGAAGTNTPAVMGSVWVDRAAGTTSTFVLKATTALPDSTAFVFNYQCLGAETT